MTERKLVTKRKWDRRVTKIVVAPPGEPLYSDLSTEIEIVEEVGGEFIEIRQPNGEGKIAIDSDEWPALRAAIDDMFATVRPMREPKL